MSDWAEHTTPLHRLRVEMEEALSDKQYAKARELAQEGRAHLACVVKYCDEKLSPANGPTSSCFSPLNVQIAKALRLHGVAITSSHPLMEEWQARGLTEAQAVRAVDICRQKKPFGRIAPYLLAPYVDEILSNYEVQHG